MKYLLHDTRTALVTNNLKSCPLIKLFLKTTPLRNASDFKESADICVTIYVLIECIFSAQYITKYLFIRVLFFTLCFKRLNAKRLLVPGQRLQYTIVQLL